MAFVISFGAVPGEGEKAEKGGEKSAIVYNGRAGDCVIE